jgi:hypothetical protein
MGQTIKLTSTLNVSLPKTYTIIIAVPFVKQMKVSTEPLKWYSRFQHLYSSKFPRTLKRLARSKDSIGKIGLGARQRKINMITYNLMIQNMTLVALVFSRMTVFIAGICQGDG